MQKGSRLDVLRREELAMTQPAGKRAIMVALSLLVGMSLFAPATVLAAESEVIVDNHTYYADRVVSGIGIDEVDAPVTGNDLDDRATVRSSEGNIWDVPVLWVRDDLKIVTHADEGHEYLPVIAYFVPQQMTVEGSAYTVTLSESVAKLFGTHEIISVYDSSTGITYILPALLRDLFVRAEQATTSETAQQEQVVPVAPADVDPAEPSGGDPWYGPSLVEIYCAQTARDDFTDEDLEFLLDLVLNKLQPQAVELLLNSFPAFRSAADNGHIGREIGLYVYYLKGDKDGLPEHSNLPANALAYVSADATKVDGDLKYGSMIGVDASSLASIDESGDVIRSEQTGKLVLTHDGTAMRTFENTLVHELFHAFMHDFNRTGMMGGTNLEDVVLDENGNFASQELKERYINTRFPNWFMEGTASSVENNYYFRYDSFKALRADASKENGFNDTFTPLLTLNNYLKGKIDDEDAYFDITYCNGYDEVGNEVDSRTSSYVTGYLADLYLYELAARNISGSSIEENEDYTIIYSDKLRMGLNFILERMHDGDTLDQVIADISPTDKDGNKLYKNTSEFESKFIKGDPYHEKEGYTTYYGDKESIAFVNTFLNYMEGLNAQENRIFTPNGSVLFDFWDDYLTPLDINKECTSDFYKIVDSNKYVASTVPDDVALSGGGRSISRNTIFGSASDSLTEQTAEDLTVTETSSDEAIVVEQTDEELAVEEAIVDEPSVAAGIEEPSVAAGIEEPIAVLVEDDGVVAATEDVPAVLDDAAKECAAQPEE